MLSADRQHWHRGMESAPAGPRRKRPVHAGIFIEVAFNRTSSESPRAGTPVTRMDATGTHPAPSPSQVRSLWQAASEWDLPGFCRACQWLGAASGGDRRRNGAPSCSGEAGALVSSFANIKSRVPLS